MHLSSKALIFSLFTIFSAACGSPHSDSELESRFSRNSDGLQGDYDKGSLQGHHFYATISNGVTALDGAKAAIEEVAGKKTLVLDDSFTVRLQPGQMLSAGYYLANNRKKHFEIYFTSDDKSELFADRYIVNFDKEFADSFSPVKGSELIITGDVTASPDMVISYLGNGKFKIKVIFL